MTRLANKLRAHREQLTSRVRLMPEREGGMTLDTRRALRARGMKPIQIWVQDEQSPAFAAEARRQSFLAASSPFAADDQAFVDAIADGWGDDPVGDKDQGASGR